MGLRPEYAPDHSELDPFLFADVGEDVDGPQLTVLSLLARLGLDPRTEALRLSKLPDEAAASALTSSIEALPGSGWSAADARLMAVRLLENLPRQRRQAGDDASVLRKFPLHAIARRWVIWGLVSGLFVLAVMNMRTPATNSVMTFGAASTGMADLASLSEPADGSWVVGARMPGAGMVKAALF